MGIIDFRRIEILLMPEDGEPTKIVGLNKTEASWRAFTQIDGSDDEYYRFRISGFDKNDKETVFMDYGEGVRPMSRSNLIRLLDAFSSIDPQPPVSTVFDSTVTKCGNSLVLKITEQCKLMQLNVGEPIRVKLERINTYDSRDNIEKLFYRKSTHEIDPYVYYADEREYFDKFVKDYGVIGGVSIEDIPFDPLDLTMDHCNAVRTKEGHVILIQIPYGNWGKEQYAKAFADAHNLEYDIINQYSWYHRGETQLIIFWLKGVKLTVNHS